MTKDELFKDIEYQKALLFDSPKAYHELMCLPDGWPPRLYKSVGYIFKNLNIDLRHVPDNTTEVK